MISAHPFRNLFSRPPYNSNLLFPPESDLPPGSREASRHPLFSFVDEIETLNGANSLEEGPGEAAPGPGQFSRRVLDAPWTVKAEVDLESVGETLVTFGPHPVGEAEEGGIEVLAVAGNAMLERKTQHFQNFLKL